MKIDHNKAVIPLPLYEALVEYDKHPSPKSFAARMASQALRRALNEHPIGPVAIWNPNPSERVEMIQRMIGSSLNWSVDESPSGKCYVRWRGEHVVTVPPELDREGILELIRRMWNDERI